MILLLLKKKIKKEFITIKKRYKRKKNFFICSIKKVKNNFFINVRRNKKNLSIFSISSGTYYKKKKKVRLSIESIYDFGKNAGYLMKLRGIYKVNINILFGKKNKKFSYLLKGLSYSGIKFLGLKFIRKIPHNGCKKKKKRRI